MEHRLTCIALLLSMLLSASCDNKPIEEAPVLTVSESLLQFPAQGGIKTISVSASSAWAYSGDLGWCVITKDYSGLSFQCEQNTSYDGRTGSIIISITDAMPPVTAELIVSQSARSTIQPNSQVVKVSAEEQDVKIEIATNSVYNSTVEEADASWLSIVETRALGTRPLTAHVKANNGFDSRYGVIRLTVEDVERTVVIQQEGQPILIKDATVWNAVQSADNNNDGVLSTLEAQTITKVTIRPGVYASLDFSGLEHCPNLEEIVFQSSYTGSAESFIRHLDISKLKQIKGLTAGHCNIEELIVNGAESLESLYCNSNLLKSLDVSGCPNLRSLFCELNQLEELNIENCSELSTVNCRQNQLTSLLLDNPKLEYVSCCDNNLTSLNLSASKQLRILECDWNALQNISSIPRFLRNLTIVGSNNMIKSLDLSEFVNLESFSAQKSAVLTNISFSGLSFLSSVSITGANELSDINLSGCTMLSRLTIKNVDMKSLDASWSHLLTDIVISGNLDNLYIAKGGQLLRKNIPQNTTVYETYQNSILGQFTDDPISFDDVNLKYLLAHTPNRAYNMGNNALLIDQNADGEISYREAAAVYTLEITADGITSMSGLEHFPNINQLSIKSNALTTIDLSAFPNLKDLTLSCPAAETIIFPKTSKISSLNLMNINYTTLDLSSLERLNYVNLSTCKIKDLAFPNSKDLDRIQMYYCDIQNMDLTANHNITHIHLQYNTLSGFLLGEMPKLEWLCVTDNSGISSLDVSIYPELYALQCSLTDIKTLDIHDNPKITTLYCESDALETLYVFRDYLKKIKTFYCKPSTAIIVK